MKVEMSGCETFYHIEGKPVFHKTFIKIMNFHYPEDRAAVKDDTGAYHIDSRGNKVYSEIYLNTYGYYNGVASVENESGFIHIDIDGKLTHKKVFIWAGNFQEDYCVVKDETGYYHIDKNGDAIYNERYSYVGDFKYGSAVVHLDNQAWHIDSQGRPLHQKKFKNAEPYHKGFAVVENEEGCFHVTKEGKALYQNRFQKLEAFYNDVAFGIDRLGQKIKVYPNGHHQLIMHIKKVVYDDLEDLLKNEKDYSIVIRHADRDKISPYEWGNDVQINEDGRKNCKELSSRIKNLELDCLSSDSPRCIETLKYLCNTLKIKENNVFGSSGVFNNYSVDRKHLNPANFRNYANTYLSTGFEDTFKPLSQSCELFFAELLRLRVSQKTIVCSHDFYIACLYNYLGITTFGRLLWPAFLEGLVVIWDDKRVKCVYHLVNPTFRTLVSKRDH